VTRESKLSENAERPTSNAELRKVKSGEGRSELLDLRWAATLPVIFHCV
jgi:hypothetical protein